MHQSGNLLLLAQEWILCLSIFKRYHVSIVCTATTFYSRLSFGGLALRVFILFYTLEVSYTRVFTS